LPAAENFPAEHTAQLDDPAHQAREHTDQHVLCMAGKAGYFCPYRGLSAGYGNMDILAWHYAKARNTGLAPYTHQVSEYHQLPVQAFIDPSN
jgi:hypothetical protein